MLRLCSESSRSYPGRSARHAVRMCFMPSGESAGRGNRLNKSRRFILGSDQVNLLIYHYLCSINRCFQALEHTFWDLKWQF